MDCYQDDLVELEAKNASSTKNIKEKVMKKTQNEANTKGRARRLSRTMLIAAILIAALSISAIAIGQSIAAQKQAELRNKLNIDGKEIPEYIEYNSEEPDGKTSGYGVEVLSSMQDNTFVWYYLLISPISKEQVEYTTWWVQREGQAGNRVADFVEEYDEQSQSLMIKVPLMVNTDAGFYENETDPVTFYLKRGYWTDGRFEELDRTTFEIIPNFITIVSEIKYFDLGGIEFTNGSTGEIGRIIEARVTSGGIEWVYECNFEADDQGRLSQSAVHWVNALEGVIRDAVMNFSDGSTKGEMIGERTIVEGDTLIDNALFLGSPIDINDIMSITIGGETYYAR